MARVRAKRVEGAVARPRTQSFSFPPVSGEPLCLAGGRNGDLNRRLARRQRSLERPGPFEIGLASFINSFSCWLADEMANGLFCPTNKAKDCRV
jgi:hypothetical protein